MSIRKSWGDHDRYCTTKLIEMRNFLILKFKKMIETKEYYFMYYN